MASLRHVTKISDLTQEEIYKILQVARDMKKAPGNYTTVLKHKTLLMLFEKPSLRTRVSFETGMEQLGGHGIFYSTADSPLGKKENMSDTARCISRFVDIVMARVKSRDQIRELAHFATVPIINALDDFAHPCQMLADLQVILEKMGSFKGLKMAYLGDIHNNVTYDLMRSAAVMGFSINVAGPSGEGYDAEEEVVRECAELCKKSGGEVRVMHDANEAVKGVDVIYTDSWMSYGIPAAEKESRQKIFMPFQVTVEKLRLAKPDCIFMNCLPADRTAEQTAEVIDGPQSIVFDQAENRLHAQKALLCFLLNAGPFHQAKRILIALGGNALIQAKEKGTFEEMKLNCENTAAQIADLIAAGHSVSVTHGNGPQAGAVYLQNDIAKDRVPMMPLFVCGAETQGWIGYMMQTALQNALLKRNVKKSVATVVTQVEVDPKDPAFQKPTKPIGRFYSKEDAEKMIAAGQAMMEDSGRGWRAVVASPKPLNIVEAEAAGSLEDHGFVVIASGGGGIPVIRRPDGVLEGVNAVIDKDSTGALLAEKLRSDVFIILTDVEGVYVDFKLPTKRLLKTLTVAEAKKGIADGQFGTGSMLPKVQACVSFVERTGREAIIASLTQAVNAIEGKSGTRIIPN